MGLSLAVEETPLRPSPTTATWLVEAVADSRKQAQLLAEMAYDAWIDDPSGARYVEYRAAQDRADALTDDLAQLVRVLRREPVGEVA